MSLYTQQNNAKGTGSVYPVLFTLAGKSSNGGSNEGDKPTASERFAIKGADPEYIKILENRFTEGAELAQKMYDMYIPKGGPQVTSAIQVSSHYDYASNSILIDQVEDMKGIGAGKARKLMKKFFPTAHPEFIKILEALRDDYKKRPS